MLPAITGKRAVIVIGKTLNHYEILDALGAGGMGEVYRARDTKLDRDVAIKVLPESFAADPDRLSRFEREAKLLASLQHSNIGAIHGLEESGGVRFLVLELIAGQTLEQRLMTGTVPVVEALHIVRQIAEALEAAHAEGVIHRDVKPANVLITDRGVVKVLDFGIAKSIALDASSGETAQATSLTMDGTLMGTPPYMSPEQIRGEDADKRADIWAFGCVAYETLAGRGAFVRETLADTLVAVLEAEPDWEALPPDTPKSVLSVLQRCLRKDPSKRQPDIVGARIEIEEALDGPRSPARVSSPPGLPGGGVVRSVAVAVGILAVALAAGWYFLGNGEESAITDRSIAVLPFETLGQDEATVFTQGIHGDVLARLSSIADLRVTSRTSVMQFRASNMSLPEIARELGVTWVVAGEVQEVGDQVQVNARLMDARQDRQVWAESYRRRLTAESLFQIQSELTEKIAEQLQAQLTPDELRVVERVPTENLAAYRLFARGRAQLDQRTAGEMRSAADSFQQAIDQDPNYALAWVGLTDALILLEDYGHAEPGSLISRAEAAAARAFELEPELAELHASFGLMHLLRRDGPAAVEELRRAVELRPSYAIAHNWLGWAQLLLGRPDAALESTQRAVALNPLSPEPLSNLSFAYLANGDPAKGLEVALRIQDMQPDFATGDLYEAVALYHLGRFEEARSVLTGLVVPWAGAGPLSTLAMVHVVDGEEALARDLLQELERLGERALAGTVLVALQENDNAFAAFQSTDRWDHWPTLSVRYLFPDLLGTLRSDARYARLVREIDRSWGLDPAEILQN